jgi:hypothetical protein
MRKEAMCKEEPFIVSVGLLLHIIDAFYLLSSFLYLSTYQLSCSTTSSTRLSSRPSEPPGVLQEVGHASGPVPGRSLIRTPLA